mmetsp:Transcript_18917/g.54796  ORF Transcript_18917/g.54796 Transcript_18917/m.54796 type:complete len:292 (-) Transcript_18917:1629-2504(-)
MSGDLGGIRGFLPPSVDGNGTGVSLPCTSEFEILEHPPLLDQTGTLVDEILGEEETGRFPLGAPLRGFLPLALLAETTAGSDGIARHSVLVLALLPVILGRTAQIGNVGCNIPPRGTLQRIVLLHQPGLSVVGVNLKDRLHLVRFRIPIAPRHPDAVGNITVPGLLVFGAVVPTEIHHGFVIHREPREWSALHGLLHVKVHETAHLGPNDDGMLEVLRLARIERDLEDVLLERTLHVMLIHSRILHQGINVKPSSEFASLIGHGVRTVGVHYDRTGVAGGHIFVSGRDDLA